MYERMIQPSDLRLLRGIRANVRRLAAHPEASERGEIVESIDCLTAELIKRRQTGRFAELNKRGRALAIQAGGLVGSTTRAGRDLADRLEGDAGDDGPRAELLALLAALSQAVPDLASNPSVEASALLDAIVDLEVALAAAYREDVEPQPLPALNLSREALQAYVREAMPAGEDVTVETLRKLSGGYSKTTLLFETTSPSAGAQAYVLRAEKPATPFFMHGSSVDAEFFALRYMHGKGVPIAEPIRLEADAGRFGARFFISRCAPGRNYGAVLGGAAKVDESLIRELVATLARIHATPLDLVDPNFRKSHLARWGGHETLTDFTMAFVEYWSDLAAKCGALTSPGIARGFAWLRANPPVSNDRPVLVHGDFGLHNVMIEDGRISAVLDWEASHIGDPADEFFLFAQVMGAFVDRPELMRLYAEAGGRPISEYRQRYFDVLNCLKGPIVGYGSLMLAEQNPGSDERTCMVGYQFIAPLLGLLNQSITAAEAVRER